MGEIGISRAHVFSDHGEEPWFPMGDLRLERIVGNAAGAEGAEAALLRHQLRPHYLLVRKILVSLPIVHVSCGPILREHRGLRPFVNGPHFVSCKNEISVRARVTSGSPSPRVSATFSSRDP